MAATAVPQSPSDTESLSQDGISPVGSPSRKVNFSDHEKEVEDDGSFDHNNSTLQWENAMNNSLSDDVKLTAVMLDDDNPPHYLDRKPCFDEGPGTFSTNYEELSDGKQGEESEDPDEDNRMPDIASQVFVNSVNVNILNDSPLLARKFSLHASPTSIGKKEPPEMPTAYELKSFDPEKQALLCQSPPADQQYNMHPCRAGSECSVVDVPPSKRRCCGYHCCTSSSLKSVASFLGAMLLFPVFLYGAYVFLPFDVPLMSTTSNRLVYTLRCGVFATFPVVLGLVVYGISRICTSSFDPFGKREREVEIHRRYVTQSSYLFVLYFFNMAVLSTYLPQELLKLIPLLTALFALSRLIYWLAFAMGRSFRGFGYGLAFLPLVAMLLANIYFMFALDPQNMFAVEEKTSNAATPAPSKLRMWG